MASGKKNYFRHSFNAFEDEKIQRAIDLLGYEGYAFYFILLELLAKRCENEITNPIKIHQQSLRNVWRKHSKSTLKVVKKLEESGLFVATFSESYIEFDIPNLRKYLGKYQAKMSPNTPNKRKEKKRKEKEKKVNSVNDTFNLNLIYNAYPRKEGKKRGFEKLKSLKMDIVKFNLILKASEDYSKHVKANGTEKKFIKQFSTWVNGACWDDVLDQDKKEHDDWFMTATDEELIKGRGR